MGPHCAHRSRSVTTSGTMWAYSGLNKYGCMSGVQISRTASIIWYWQNVFVLQQSEQWWKFFRLYAVGFKQLPDYQPLWPFKFHLNFEICIENSWKDGLVSYALSPILKFQQSSCAFVIFTQQNQHALLLIMYAYMCVGTRTYKSPKSVNEKAGYREVKVN